MSIRFRFVCAVFVTALFVWGCSAEAEVLDLSNWDTQCLFRYDYVLEEDLGIARESEPVEVTLSVPGTASGEWETHVRVVRLTGDNAGELVPHEVLGKTSVLQEDGGTPAESVNVIFLADCPGKGRATYRLFWGLPASGQDTLPPSPSETGLLVSGEAPGLTLENEYYHIQLDPKSGAILSARRTDQDDDHRMFYKTIPCHFGTDVWSPPQSWDHDYDWAQPPNQKVEGGAVALRYHRWGPLEHYRDVVVSITYTFYAHVPYVQVSLVMNFTEDRSVHAVRMGEIVVSHSEKPVMEEGKEASPEVFTHYAWPERDGSLTQREINANRGEDGRANLPGIAPGALGILGRDVPWVAGYNKTRGYGFASLRRAQFAGNVLGNATPQAAPCTYVANYGWGFSYWSRPMVYPLGERETPLDQNTALAAGSLFTVEEALLLFKPDEELRDVRKTHQEFTHPLHQVFLGTGPW